MNEQDKQLLLVDLCGRLPYYPIVHVEHDIGGFIETADLQVYGYEGKLKLLREDNETFCYLPIEECKLYLRPMSSITVEEKEELLIYVLDNKEDCKRFKINDEGAIESIDNNIFRWVYFDSDTTSRYIDWLNKNHFDYRGLIEKGLAIEVTKDNNPYKD